MHYSCTPLNRTPEKITDMIKAVPGMEQWTHKKLCHIPYGDDETPVHGLDGKPDYNHKKYKIQFNRNKSRVTFLFISTRLADKCYGDLVKNNIRLVAILNKLVDAGFKTAVTVYLALHKDPVFDSNGRRVWHANDAPGQMVFRGPRNTKLGSAIQSGVKIEILVNCDDDGKVSERYLIQVQGIGVKQYRKLVGQPDWNCNLDSALKIAGEEVKQRLATGGLPAPHAYEPEDITLHNDSAERANSLAKARVLRVVYLHPSGKFSDKIADPSKTDLWFVLRVSAYITSGSNSYNNYREYRVAVNDTGWYEVAGEIHLRIKGEDAYKCSKLTRLDKVLINAAIGQFASMQE
jgi:hypothetical protein